MQQHRIDAIGGPILARLQAVNLVRDRALADSRGIVRSSANAIRAVHRGELESAETQVQETAVRLEALLEETAEYPAIRSAGYVQDAMKEYAESRVLQAIVAHTALPSPTELSIDDAPYLNGLAEAASELRRMILDKLRSDDFDAAERFLQTMDEIYAFLVTVDYPDGVTGGLRRTTDALRAVLERTRGDLTMTGAQKRLQRSIEAALGRLDASASPAD